MHGDGLPYQERGEGTPVLLVPGTGFGAETWGAFGDRLAFRRRVIAYDRRGFTDAAPEPAESMRVHADDARLVLERTGADPADVVGWSAGGLVALALAVEHPEACRSLLLIEPSVWGLRGVTPSALGMTLRARALRIARGQRAATDLSYRWTFAYRGRRRSAWDEMPEEWREQVLSHASAVAAEETQETSLRYPRRDAVRALRLPVTIVLGERRGLLSPHRSLRRAAHIERPAALGAGGIARRPPRRARRGPVAAGPTDAARRVATRHPPLDGRVHRDG